MFPIGKSKLALGEIANYWAREIQPPASRDELLKVLEGAWWLGEFCGDSAISRLELLKGMFKSMRHRDDLGIVFVEGERVGEPPPKKLPDGSLLVDVRHRICLPSSDVNAWDEGTCDEAFRALAQTSSYESYPEFAPVLTLIELTHGDFISWLEGRGYDKPIFWRPASAPPQHARPSSNDGGGAKSLAIKKAIDELWSNGIPPNELSAKDRNNRIVSRIKENGDSLPTNPARAIQRILAKRRRR
jgi:hypothetical protein